MKLRLFAALVCGGMLIAPLVSAATAEKKNTGMSQDMREAIAFERHKDMADARQARMEARHPSGTYSNSNADRTADHGADRTVKPDKK